MRISFLSLCFGLAALAGVASAQIPAAAGRALSAQAITVDRLATQQGFARLAGPIAAQSAPGVLARTPLTLRAGQTYRIIAACAEACGPLDIRLYDWRGALIAQDAIGDDIVHVRPQSTGAFRVELSAPSCAQRACAYSVSVYGR